jgi:pantoate--beta-alanine ligase
VPGLSAILCGASRPGHFQGVATVVAKLFNMVQPDVAVFGEKDFQQLLVIRRLTADLNFPIEIIGVPTVREPDGLAMSSRNGYLTPEQRGRSPQLYRALRQAAQALARGALPSQARQEALATLAAAGFEPDYVSVRLGHDLSEAADRPISETALHSGAVVILAAARLGTARLIDNLVVSVDRVDNR